MKTLSQNYSPTQRNLLVLLRVLIGWHFLYEGIVKLYNPSWSAAGYLNDSGGFLAPIFQSLASSATWVPIIDFLNTWGLIAVGLGLLLGLFTRVALVGGMALLGLYYLSHPPFIGAEYALPSEGSYLWVNKNLIELFAMAVLFVFPTSHLIGLDRLLQFRGKKQIEPTTERRKVPTTVPA
ncbi:MAG: DoxX family membrane protein [Cyclobacteriaceae bacterium]|mgnify:CR=1 FL=1